MTKEALNEQLHNRYNCDKKKRRSMAYLTVVFHVRKIVNYQTTQFPQTSAMQAFHPAKQNHPDFTIINYKPHNSGITEPTRR